MKREYDVDLSAVESGRSTNRRSEEYLLLRELLRSRHENMRLIYDDAKKAQKRRASIAVTLKRENLPVKLFINGKELYVVRTDLAGYQRKLGKEDKHDRV